jgi:hypothetical protein
MKLFWLVIGIFMIFAAFVAWTRLDGSSATPYAANVNQQDTAVSSAPAPPARLPHADERDSPTVDDAVSPERNLIEELSRETYEQATEDELDELLEAERLANELYDSATGRTPAYTQPDPADLGGKPEPAPPMTSLDLKQDHQHNPDPPRNPDNPWENLVDQPKGHQPLEHSVREQPDGTVVLDDTFEIKGRGTSAEPYEITWDLLLSAAETYQPRLGMNKLPERIQMLDGKHIRISGHLLFPMVGVDAREVLVMLNMWDGCCLGTMPSPYDAIEVQLAQPVRANNRNFMNYGTIEGKLSVDPYLINDWLLGLYVLEEAKLNIGM